MAVSTAVDQSAVARVVGIQTNFVNLFGGVAILPQRVALVGQGATAATYSTDKRTVRSAFEVGDTYGFGSPLHLAALQLLPPNGDGLGSIPLTVYPLEDDASGIAATGDITPAGTITKAGAFRVLVNGIPSGAFSVSPGDSVATVVTAITAAMSAEVSLPITATDSTTKVDVTAKWKGESGNVLSIQIEGPTDTGLSFAITQPSGGAINPDVDPALALIGNVWETMVVSCFNYDDTATLDKYQTFGEGRWGPLVRKPLVVFSGTNEADSATLIAAGDARKDDRVNSLLSGPGSVELPFVIAARMVARIAKRANENPPYDYGSLAATGLIAGADSDQWDYVTKDALVKAGVSTSRADAGVVKIEDTVTFYHPDGDPTPAYRYVVDVVKLQNILFNLDLRFATDEWDGAPLVPDNQTITNAAAKKPKMAVAEANSMIDQLGLEAIISDPETAKEKTVAQINTTNPKRLDLSVTVSLSGNTNIISVDLNFGFFFGQAAVVA